MHLFQNNMNQSTLENISDICRICLEKKSDMISIFDEYSDDYNEPIFSIIMNCATVQITKGDGLPELLCTQCHTKLGTAYSFKRDCEQSDSSLRQCLSNSFTENRTDDFKLDDNDIKLEVESYPEITMLSYYETNNIKSEDLPSSNVDEEIELENESCETTLFFHNNNSTDNDDDNENVNIDVESDEEKSEDEQHPNKSKEITDRGKTQKLRRLICYECSNIFYKPSDIFTHIPENHSNQIYKCDWKNCNREFRAYLTYAKHRNTIHHVEYYLNCHQCSNTYKHKQNLVRHIEDKHDQFRKSQGEEYKCEICNKSSVSLSGLELHKRIHKITKETYICDNCGKRFHLKFYYERHLQLLSVRGKCVERPNRPESSRRKLLCTHCGKVFRRPYKLNIHMRLHMGEKPFKCDKCDYCCRSKDMLISHMRSHTSDRPYKCSYCEKAFPTKSYLTIHERSHTGDRPYVCIACNKAFTNNKDLKVHERTHTVIKLYSCEICGNEFATLQHFNRHKKKHETVIVKKKKV